MFEVSNMICPRCKHWGCVRWLTGVSKEYAAKCFNCNAYLKSEDLFAEEEKKQTNADRIRAMTDEELAMLLGAPTIVSPPWCDMNYDCPYIDQDPARCDLCALDWLKQEATNES